MWYAGTTRAVAPRESLKRTCADDWDTAPGKRARDSRDKMPQVGRKRSRAVDAKVEKSQAGVKRVCSPEPFGAIADVARRNHCLSTAPWYQRGDPGISGPGLGG